MPRLSVIIVNYNVVYFLEQALRAVQEAGRGIDMEVFVVDNASHDRSVDMVRELFPDVHLIANDENVGFARANNQAIRRSTGQYVLLLNPDTVVQEDTFTTCLDFMDAHADVGGLGVRMVDGRGDFLPESKRDLPTPWVAFCKMSGLSTVCPRSRTFGRYHLGFLDPDEVHDVHVLSGAFLWMRGDLCRSLDGLDESFFMYGEDIDLSHRIVQSGHRNVYLPTTQIIHYKGESTRRNSLNYVRIFYEAMAIFARKHYSGARGAVFVAAVYLAMAANAVLTMAKRVVRALWHPVLDGTLILAGAVGIKAIWAVRIKGDAGYYPEAFTTTVLPLYAVLWVVATAFVGGYIRPYRLRDVVRGVGLGTLLIAAVYGFLPDDLRFSRALILLGGVWAFTAMLATRALYHLVTSGRPVFELDAAQRTVIVGGEAEAGRVHDLLRSAAPDVHFVGFVHPERSPEDDRWIGRLDQLDDLVHLFAVNEVVFCNKDVPSTRIIEFMTRMGRTCQTRIVPGNGLSIIGSRSKTSAGDLYGLDVDLRLARPRLRAAKAVLDVAVALGLLVTLPVSIWFVRDKRGLLWNVRDVLLRRRTWVGYTPGGTGRWQLPDLPDGVLNPLVLVDGGDLPVDRLNLSYARDYGVERDLSYLWRGRAHLGDRS